MFAKRPVKFNALTMLSAKTIIKAPSKGFKMTSIAIITCVFIVIAGFFADNIARRIYSRYPCTWVDVVCQSKPNKHTWRGLNVKFRVLISVLSGAFMLSVAVLYPQISNATFIGIGMFVVFGTWLALIDFEHKLIPDIIIFPMFLIGAGVMDSLPWIAGGWTESFGAAVAGYLLPILIGMMFYKKSDSAIGGGDIKLLSVGGLWLGIMGLSVAIGASAALAAIYGKYKKTREIPYAPFFIVGALVSIILLGLI